MIPAPLPIKTGRPLKVPIATNDPMFRDWPVDAILWWRSRGSVVVCIHRGSDLLTMILH